MRYGYFITSKARKERRCRQENCREDIQVGEEYCGLIITSKKVVKPFMIAYHRQCFFEGLEQTKNVRMEQLREKRAAPRPYRLVQLDPEIQKRKLALIRKLSVNKRFLMAAYFNGRPKSINHNKAVIITTIKQLQAEEFGGHYWWHFGENLRKLLATGVDPNISEADALFADQNGPEVAVRLLSQGLEFEVDINTNTELAKSLLTSALISNEGLPEAFLNLAKAMDYPQPFFRWGESLAAQASVRNDIFKSDEVADAQQSNEQLAEYFRMLAGKLKENSLE